ncbi:A/G-specific adenine glycosylase [Litoribacter ruber]|nr:A/G-specific adenine glycosylase [Litoribacter ruber]MBT0812541.1 A/G-specific adenine glycosylase [Litoribacter ruber]
MNFKHFTRQLLHWYPQNMRDLPWRNTQNPYIIWLSEIILQQTRVVQGLPYFESFLEKYPTVQDLAKAPLDDVLRLWQGLGYYSRARNLHHCAIQVSDEFNGQFPDNYKDLLKLKGVGSYTAAAIASFAYREKVAVVDGNVFRVLARYFGVSEDISSPKGKKEFERLANELIPADQPDEFNQAIMEFGALQCTPKNPDCSSCPLQENCLAFQNDLIGELPVKKGKVKVRTRNFVYYAISCGENLMMKKRGGQDIWEGLHDFPLEEIEELDDFELASSKYYRELEAISASVLYEPEIKYRHILSHQRIFSTFVEIKVQKDSLSQLVELGQKHGWRLLSAKEVEELGKPKLIVNYLNDQNI